MSSRPSDEHTPAPLRYPGAGGPVGHRLNARVILAVIFVIALVAFLITAAIVLPPKSNQPPPLAPTIGKPSAMATQEQSQPDQQVRLASTDAVALPKGVSVTPAPGWKTCKQSTDGVVLCNADGSATLALTVLDKSETDAAAALQADINRVTGANSNYSNLLLTDVTKDTTDSSKFPQWAGVGYLANLVTQGGTVPINGLFIELLNPSSKVGVFQNFQCNDDENFCPKAYDDMQSMFDSML